ncbi:MAG: hypothetical protein EXQ95_01660 [Alphaproteobacteria bacterium]|nr:hypothetical protein [Alphaproteobacteria bacterium]
MTLPRRILGAALLMAVAACTSSPSVPPGSCPKVAVLGELGELVRFRPGAGRDLTDIEFQAKFSSFAFGCRYDKEAVSVEVDLELEASRGPAMAAGRTTFQYFAAVTNPAGEIVAKETFNAEVEFKGNTTRLVVADELVQRIPLLDRSTGPSWNVLLGLQLTDEQRDWARRRQTR